MIFAWMIRVFSKNQLILVQDETVDEALCRMKDHGILQPALFSVQQRYYLKMDNTAIPLASASCYAEAVEQLFMAFWVFNVEYPYNLRVFYSFIGYMFGVETIKIGPTVREFLRAIRQ